jgi:predicted ATPase with chaperone activity
LFEYPLDCFGWQVLLGVWNRYGGLLYRAFELMMEVLETLRQPMEENVVTVARAAGAFTYPANFIFVGACNPCPCRSQYRHT